MNTTDDLRTALAEDDGNLPERWNPDDVPGATLVGTLLGVETIATKLGEGQLAKIEDADDGTVYGVLLGRTALRKRWEQQNPQPGDTIGLKFIGYVEPRNKDSFGYFNYALRVLRGSSAAANTSAEPVEQDGEDELPF